MDTLTTTENANYIQALLDRIEAQRRQLKQLADEIDALRAKSQVGRASAASHVQQVFEGAFDSAGPWAETRVKNMKLG